jgi:Holliday junction resolvase
MKRLKIISIIIIFSSLCACEPPVTFSEPQPTDIENVSIFPNRLIGDYLSLSDSSILNVNKKIIQRIYDFDYIVHSNQLDSTVKLIGDTLVNINTNEKKIVKQNGDSLVIHVHNIDTLFQINYDNVVRKFKGYYFLNTRYNKTNWTVEKMKLSKGQLVISTISTQLDIENLKEITGISKDTVIQYKFTASKKQFKEFIKNDGFSDSEKFIRLKE